MSRRIVEIPIVLLFFVFLPLHAQAPPPPADPLDRTTPRGAVIGFLTAAHKGDWSTAIQYLDNVKSEDPVEIATQLSVVLDQGLPANNLDLLSVKPEGNLNDNLPASKELAGTIVTNGGPLDVTLDHVRRGTQSVWLFSGDTLKEVPAVYQEFNSAWIPNYIPHVLLRRGWLGVPLWQWIVLAIGVALALFVAAAMRKIAVPLLRRLFRSIALDQDEWMLDRLTGPLRGLISLLVLATTISVLRLPLFAREAWYFIGGGLAIILGGWLFTRVVQVSGRLLNRSVERRGGADATAVIRLCERTVNVLTFAVVVVLLLKGVGLIKDVTTLVAGLGVGGIAIALAAQKTLENLFGGISIIFDKTIRVGDTCRIGTQSGTVEDIGLRSTSLRTDARTVLTVPNSQLSAMNIENFGMREKSYFYHVIGIRYETTAQQMRALLDALRKLLTSDAHLEPSTSRVRLIRCAPSSLDLEIVAYVLTTDGLKFLEVQEDLLLRIMDTIESNGTAPAFPSQTLYLNRDHTLPTASSPPPADA
ncbi:MAG: mechanosensitive ion channel family protein [Bryobacteraceae bacterium]